MSPSLLFEWFWLLAAAVLLVNLAIWRARLGRMQRAGEASADDIVRFLRPLCVGGLLACGLLLVIQRVAGWNSPVCAQVLPLSDPWALASLAVTLGAWSAVVGWVCVGEGAELISRLSPALGRRYPGRAVSARVLRLAVPGLLLLALLGPLLSRMASPPGEAVARQCYPAGGGSP